MQIDHLVIIVPDLAQATADYTAQGYTVTPGGEHMAGDTHNALVCFVDGAYLELIAFKKDGTNHRWERFRPWPGIIDFALRYESVETAIQQLNARGLAYTYLGQGGRKRPDGVQLTWRTGVPPHNTSGLPFVIEDVTPRELRVPSGAAIQHANGATGVHQLDVAVNDLSVARLQFESLLGEPAKATADGWAFQLGVTTLRIFTAPANSSAAHLLKMRGAGPVDWSVSKI